MSTHRQVNLLYLFLGVGHATNLCQVPGAASFIPPRSPALSYGQFLATITIDFGESIQLLTSVVFSRNKSHRVYENVTDIPGGVHGHVVGFPDRRADTSLLVLLITCLCTVTFFYLPSALFSSVPYKERLFIQLLASIVKILRAKVVEFFNIAKLVLPSTMNQSNESCNLEI